MERNDQPIDKKPLQSYNKQWNHEGSLQWMHSKGEKGLRLKQLSFTAFLSFLYPFGLFLVVYFIYCVIQRKNPKFIAFMIIL